MEITVADALRMLPSAIDLTRKLVTIISTNTAMSAEDEIAALEASRMRPSDELTGADAKQEG